MGVQITGPRYAIERVLSATALSGAKLRDLHNMAWIEVPELAPDLQAFVRHAGCKVHASGDGSRHR